MNTLVEHVHDEIKRREKAYAFADAQHKELKEVEEIARGMLATLKEMVARERDG